MSKHSIAGRLKSIIKQLKELDESCTEILPTRQFLEVWLPEFTSYPNLKHPVPALEDAGYGFMEILPAGSDKPSLMAFAFSDEPSSQREYVRLIECFALDIVHLANHIHKYGLLQPIIITPKREIMCGQRRVMAIAYNALKQNKSPLETTVLSLVQDPVPAEALLGERLNTRQRNPMEESRALHNLRNAGLKITETADRVCMDSQVVKAILELMNLSPQNQQRVSDGELGVVRALRIIRGEDASTF